MDCVHKTVISLTTVWSYRRVNNNLIRSHTLLWLSIFFVLDITSPNNVIKLGKIPPHTQTNPPNPAQTNPPNPALVYSLPLPYPTLVSVSILYEFEHYTYLFICPFVNLDQISTKNKTHHKTILELRSKASCLQTMRTLNFPFTYQTSEAIRQNKNETGIPVLILIIYT